MRAGCSRVWMLPALLAAMSCAVPPGPAQPRLRTERPRLDVRHAVCLERTYEYQLFTPGAATPLPAMLLLHGAGGKSGDVLDVWKPLARRAGVILIAPEIPRELSFEAIAPAVFRCIVEDAKRAVTVDAERVYLFGWSMGGYLAFDGAMLASQYFAGTAVYAAAIASDYVSIVDRAERKMPIAIYIGDRDQFVSLAQVRGTRDLLIRRGFPVHYLEFAGQDHQLAPVGDRLTADAWAYLAPFRLPPP